MTDWQRIGTQNAQTGTALRFTGKFAHAIMVMLKVVPTTLYPFHFQGICILQVLFFCADNEPDENTHIRIRQIPRQPCIFPAWPQNRHPRRDCRPSLTTLNFTGGNSLKNKENIITGERQLHTRKKFRIPYQNIIMGAAAFAYFFALQTNQVLATDMWSKAESIMKDVYGKILGISTIAAIVTASVALLLMNFSKSGKTVDESRAWLKRIAISWVILNGLGFILAYVTPFFSDGKWNG